MPSSWTTALNLAVFKNPAFICRLCHPQWGSRPQHDDEKDTASEELYFQAKTNNTDVSESLQSQHLPSPSSTPASKHREQINEKHTEEATMIIHVPIGGFDKLDLITRSSIVLVHGGF